MVAIIAAVIAFIITAWLGQPVPILGFEQTFEQPNIPFPHTIHAGTASVMNSEGDAIEGMGLDCTYCHRTVTSQPNAGVPAVEVCAFCHRVVGSEDNTLLAEVRAKTGIDTIDSAGIVGNSLQPINWRRVHRLPDHVRFVHSAHILFLTNNPGSIRNATDTSVLAQGSVEPAKVCSTCHGNVAAMEQVTQAEPLKMGFCVDCHIENEAPTDCAICHH